VAGVSIRASQPPRLTREGETDSLMASRRNSRPLAPRPSVPDPRPHLLRAVLTFVRSARSTPGVLRIALLGSLATDKPVPKDADVLVSIDADIDLDPLARLGRRLQGTAQAINLGADILLADARERSAHRPVATYRRTLCRTDGYACASGREAGRCRAHSARIGGNPDAICSARALPPLPSRPGEFHPEPLTDPDGILSHHPAPAIARRLPPSTERRAPPGEPVGPNQRR
jgi:hypothetical protein